MVVYAIKTGGADWPCLELQWDLPWMDWQILMPCTDKTLIGTESQPMHRRLLAQVAVQYGVLFRLIITGIKNNNVNSWPRTWDLRRLKTSMMAEILDQCSLGQENTVTGLAQTPADMCHS